ncbi:uncharacterized protein B0P05DRAFT_533785 [Gilbertella persicaria]|uniref:uncharacterized protein n=1 Tax=Gilbertella persicaria TaxID=101096 RepID=UPI00221F452B|nr:uncharacterized protein B0P05DRAFT_533785 [Gilbertella persicaria]KAI8085798.1 hypothetical protein B0P05DRAFT_533785 [Gilbertella persicaria]
MRLCFIILVAIVVFSSAALTQRDQTAICSSALKPCGAGDNGCCSGFECLTGICIPTSLNN